MEMAYRERWQAEIAALKKILAGDLRGTWVPGAAIDRHSAQAHLP